VCIYAKLVAYNIKISSFGQNLDFLFSKSFIYDPDFINVDIKYAKLEKITEIKYAISIFLQFFMEIKYVNFNIY
jgi:hypothetical protein